MSIVRLKIDVSGTVGDEAWRQVRQYDEIQSADFGPQFGSGGRCNHPLNGSALKSGCRHRFSPSMLFRTTWSKTES
jgi:hypothetical protein